jgi:hypothetical protein
VAQYLTVADFKLLTDMPGEFVDYLESKAPGWLDAQLAYYTGQINARLAKRYAVPFQAPVPDAARGWLARLVTPRAYRRRGVDPNDEQYADVKADAGAADKEIEEAANAVDGLYDLPLRQDTAASGISKGGTRAYSEQSPYVFQDRQSDVGRNEDLNGRGSDG